MAWFSHEVGTAVVGSFLQARYGPTNVIHTASYNGTAGSIVVIVRTH